MICSECREELEGYGYKYDGLFYCKECLRDKFLNNTQKMLEIVEEYDKEKDFFIGYCNDNDYKEGRYDDFSQTVLDYCRDEFMKLLYKQTPQVREQAKTKLQDYLRYSDELDREINEYKEWI